MKAKCKHFGQCGGCKFLDIPYEEQLKNKETKIKELFGECPSIIPSPEVFFYRNRMDYAFGPNYTLGLKKGKFDIIIIDLPEPIEEGPAYLLYTREFYELVRDRLSDDGIICVQAGSAAWMELLNLSAVNNTLKSVFSVVCPYQVDIPSFGGPWGFCLASVNLDPTLLSPAEIDNRISARLPGSPRFYDGLSHQGMFSLPKHLRTELSQQARLITDNNPLYMYQSKIATT